MPAPSDSLPEPLDDDTPPPGRIDNGRKLTRRPSRAEAEAAVRVLLAWAGDDPTREGLRGTPGRVARAYAEFFRGYAVDPVELLQRTFAEVEGYDEMVILKDIRF